MSTLESKIIDGRACEFTDRKLSIDNFRKDITDLKKSSDQISRLDIVSSEEVLQEFSERVSRKRNLIIFGVFEQAASSNEERGQMISHMCKTTCHS